LNRIQKLIIQANDDGLELLSWISNKYTYLTLEKWKQEIINYRVLVNGQKTNSEIILNHGDIVTYNPEPIIEPKVDKDYRTIFENNDLLAIDKPSNLPCHPGGIYFENTLWYLLKEKYENFSLVNRLDRETSGILLIAKNKKSASFYFEKMRERKIEKEYLVLVHGVVQDDLDAIGWLMNDSESIIRKKRKFIPDDNALSENVDKNPDRESAHSLFEPIKSNSKYSLLHCKIFTGRTHQIRATICSLGYPVVGDKIYGLDDNYFIKFINDSLTIDDKQKLVLNYQALHSFKTTVPMMNGGSKTFISAHPTTWPIQF